MKKTLIASVLFLFIAFGTSAQTKKPETFSYDLKIFQLDEPDSVLFEKVKYSGKKAYHLKKLRKNNIDGGPDAAYLKNFEFTNGTIECDIASEIFTGIVFRSKNGEESECIYFRPFNAGTEKHKNTVQYVAKGSKYTWHFLRKNFPGKYESGADIKKNEWFHVKLVIKDTSVKVYVNDNPDPVLLVNDMKYGISSGSVGFWSWDGYFANLKITKE